MKWSASKRYKDFVITKVLPLAEIQVTLIEAIHEPTGASIVHLANEDEENSFCLGFQTLPSSGNGAPHILEHIVLCGSKNYPTKDPFFSMSRRSLHTFMNAMTGADFTAYLAASQIEKDFYHLLDVYLDAVFYPQLKKMSFLQEGHRLEFADPKDPNTPLLYKGVVYNEMKGAMSSADSRLWHSLFAHIFPDLPYAHNSGGDPTQIPTLSYEELKEFYHNYYHPSHCVFYFYGNIPLQKHLDFLDKKLLHKMNKQAVLTPIPEQTRFSHPKMCHENYPIAHNEDPNKKSILAIAYLTCHVQDQEELLALSLLESILMDTDASLLKYPLLQSSLMGTVYSHLDNEMSECPWVFIFKGVNEEDVDPIKKIFFETLQKLVQEKIPKKLIDSSLHQLEFHRTEIVEEGLPYGLHLFMRSALIKLHGCETESGLIIHTLFDKLQKKLKDPTYLPSLIDKYLLKNTHRVDLILKPDPQLAGEEQAKEEAFLKQLKEDLTEEEKQKILKQSQELQTYQAEEDPKQVEKLPVLHVKDIPKSPKNFPLVTEKEPLPCYFHDCFTNQILYADLTFDLPNLSDEELAVLPLFNSFLTDLGAGRDNYKKTVEKIHAYTGGIVAHLDLHVQTKDNNQFFPSISLHGSALYKNDEKLFNLLKAFIQKIDCYDSARIKELLIQEKTHLEGRKIRGAMRYAISSSLASFSYAQRLHDLWFGMGYYINVEKLCKDIDKAIPYLEESFNVLHDKIFHQMPDLLLSCDKQKFTELKKKKFFHIGKGLKKTSHDYWQEKKPTSTFFSSGYFLPSPVAFTSYGLKTVGYTHEDAPALVVLSELLTNAYLHEEIREKGGAYGSGANYRPQTGHFYFYAYRDPHLSRTLKTCKEALEKASQGTFSQDQLFESKLGIVQHMDIPVSPGNRALVAYNWHRSSKTFTQRKHFREKLLAVTKKDIEKAIKRSLLPYLDKGKVVSFAEKKFFEEQNKELQNPLKLSSLH